MVEGRPVDLDERLFGFIRVLSMGFTWAFYLVQAMHIKTLRRSPSPPDYVLGDSSPVPTLNPKVAAALPCCDNLNLLGLSKSSVNEVRLAASGAIQEEGFLMREEVSGCLDYVCLGFQAH